MILYVLTFVSLAITLAAFLLGLFNQVQAYLDRMILEARERDLDALDALAQALPHDAVTVRQFVAVRRASR
jgi:hypothetical protein